jgi:uncharacterized membrane protein
MVGPIALGAAKCIGTGAGVSDAILIALNLGVVAYGFSLFLLSSLLWGSVALIQREPKHVIAVTAVVGAPTPRSSRRTDSRHGAVMSPVLLQLRL